MAKETYLEYYMLNVEQHYGSEQLLPALGKIMIRDMRQQSNRLFTVE
jgi:hypothetical protein